MKAVTIFERLWKQYTDENPSAGEIYNLFRSQGDKVVNDHVAFRTFDDPRVNIDVLARPFIEAGYVPAGEYVFEAKKLKARHYELPGDPESPRVFISELILEQFSDQLQSTIRKELGQVPEDLLTSPELILSGRIFDSISFETYKSLREESEYAAWMYAFGYRANHFTVSINYLKKFERIEALNYFLKENGYQLNSSGGEVKGTPGQLLEQSSTLADKVQVHFNEGPEIIPGCYYEFARRYTDANGKLFNGFIAGSADKIFESTDYRSS
jgi:2-oxoadipate dioxygenase/decarboxylase